MTLHDSVYTVYLPRTWLRPCNRGVEGFEDSAGFSTLTDCQKEKINKKKRCCTVYISLLCFEVGWIEKPAPTASIILCSTTREWHISLLYQGYQQPQIFFFRTKARVRLITVLLSWSALCEAIDCIDSLHKVNMQFSCLYIWRDSQLTKLSDIQMFSLHLSGYAQSSHPTDKNKISLECAVMLGILVKITFFSKLLLNHQ